MKRLLLLLFPTILIAHTLRAQTNPVAQTLPYAQNFDALATTSTTYPDGWQGWLLAGSPSASFNTAAPASDKALLTGGASSTTNGAYNYNGKLGFLNSGSADNALVLALSTVAHSNISIQYDVSTLRNPFDGAANTRVNEVILQYRVGSTGDFTSITGTEYQNNTTTQTGSGITTPQNLITENTLLPAACENQPLVQLRWVNRQVSGAGSRPGFAVDNIQIGGGAADVTPPAILAFKPLNGDTAVAPTTKPAVTFSENIQFGAGNAVLHNVTLGTSQAIALSSATASISNNLLTLNVKLSPNKTYFITLDSNAVQDLSGNAFTGLQDSTAWTFSTAGQVLSFNFNDCTPVGSAALAGGFTQYSVSGTQKWGCTTFGQNSSNGIEINGYSSGPQTNEQWLISPAFDLTAFNYPLLNFSSEVAYTGPSLQLVVSTNYDGVSNPNTATWSPLNGRFPGADVSAWQLSSGINLSAFKDSSVYVAFVYTSSPTLNAARWDIDDVSITNSATAPAPSISNTTAGVAFDYVKAGTTSAPQAFTFWGNDFAGALNITAPAGFRVSKDSVNYSSSISYTLAEVNAGLHTAYVEFVPTAANANYSDSLTFTSTGYNQRLTGLSGTSLRSLKVVNWNMEWFGSTEQNPANDSLQQANATTVMKFLNADIFALAEVVDTARIRAVANQLGYSMVISDFGSYADSITDVDYSSAQKLAFLYKDSVIRKIRTYGVLRNNASPNAYKNWSSGRFPFYMEAEAKLDGDSARIGFFVLHGKANTGTAADKIDSYNRRLNGNIEFKDSLDAEYRHTNFLILGDYNDALNKTITTEMAPDTTTSYINFINDSTDYKPLTLPLALALAGKKSTVGNANVIDNVIASQEMALAYLPNSAQVVDGVAKLVASYGTTTSDHYPVMSRYNLHILATPAPVTDFTVKDNNGTIALAWNTTYELNTQSFIVEKSANQRDFSPVDTVNAQGTTSLPTAYSTTDKHPFPGTTYYRLKTVSRDGTFVYSEVKSVTLTLKESIFQLLWCILGHQLQVWIDWNQQPTNATVQLIDLFGRVRYTGTVVLQPGRNSKLLDVSTIPTGIYFLRVQTNTQVKVSTIFVSH